MFMRKNNLAAILCLLLLSQSLFANSLTSARKFISSVQHSAQPQTNTTYFKLEDPFFITDGNNINKQPNRGQADKPLINRVVNMHYINANKIVTLLNKKQLGLIEQGEGIYPLNSRNAIMIHARTQHFAQIKQLIPLLDKPSPQILITARIINIDNDYVKTLGAYFTTESNNKQNQYQATTNNQVSIPIIKFRNNVLLNMHLDALEKAGHARVISSPRLLTLNHKAALIEAGEEVPYQEKTGVGNTSIAFKKAVLRLKVTPLLLSKQHILLQLAVNEDKVSDLIVNGVPAIRTQKLTTEVLVKNQQTLMLGGIFEQGLANQIDGVPGLSKLPLVGGLFRHHRRVRKQKQLLIFVTPTIITG